MNSTNIQTTPTLLPNETVNPQVQQRNDVKKTKTSEILNILGVNLSTPNDVRNFIIVGAIYLVLIALGIMFLTPFDWAIYKFRQGFFCDDRSIQFERKSDTIDDYILGVSTLFPVIIIFIVEKFTYIQSSDPNNNLLRNCVKWFREYTAGMLVQFVIFNAVKNFAGELRPDFINTCKPDKFINCTERTYITDYVCTNTELSAFAHSNASLSFPSGHASTAFYEAIFVIFYLHVRVKTIKFRHLKNIMQTICFLWGSFTAISRISDNKHHWWDVLAGTILGIVTGVVWGSKLTRNLFRTRLELIARSRQLASNYEDGL